MSAEPNGKGGFLRIVLPSAVSVLVSIAGASFIVALTAGRTEERVEEHGRRIVVLEAASYERTASMAALRSRQDAVERVQFQDDERLHRIEDKIDRILERERIVK